MTFLDFLDDAGIAYTLERLYRIRQIQFLCDHQKLPYTPIDPRRRVGMTEIISDFVVEAFPKQLLQLKGPSYFSLKNGSVVTQIQIW